ncbi:hypothetical protein [Microbacterium pygmaeum]|uniref:hypothetical protein n=1 Tax=Microbacterium pygmaeum TaxID=370764 RepID=UPI000B8A04B0|nr:hypothetical protein [Microbacterium pygmaeum]
MSSNERQRIEKVPGARRAKLTPAPGSTGEPVPADDEGDGAAPPEGGAGAASGPNDQRLRQDVPPHY